MNESIFSKQNLISSTLAASLACSKKIESLEFFTDCYNYLIKFKYGDFMVFLFRLTLGA